MGILCNFHAVRTGYGTVEEIQARLHDVIQEHTELAFGQQVTVLVS